MTRSHREVWSSGLIALLVIGAEISSPPTARAQIQPREAQVLQQEIAALRQKLAILEKQNEQPQPIRKLVATTPLAADVADTQRYVGTIQAESHIKIRPLISGYLGEVLVKEGQTVKKGDVLFRIVPTLYQAKLAVELADITTAQIELKSTENLFKNKVVSQNEMALAQAKLAKAEARAKLASDELSYTTILAPLDGAIGRLQVQKGSLVKEADILTTLSDNSAIRFYFNVSEVRYAAYQAELAKLNASLQAKLLLASGKELPLSSQLTAVEANSDSVMFRADFPNPDHLLLHGQTGQVSVNRVLKNVLVIPQRATFEIRDKRYVYVVGKDDVVSAREIQLQIEMEEIVVIRQGLSASDKVIVEGVQQVRDGEHVEYEFRKPEEIMPGVKKHE